MVRRFIQLGVWSAVVTAAVAQGAAPPPAAPASAKPKVVVLNLRPSDPSLKEVASSLSEQVLTELGRTQRVDCVGQNDLAAVLGLEQERQLLGCSDQSNSCLAEFSAALGAPWVVTGSIARLGKAIRVDLKLISTRDGSASYRGGKTITDEAEVFEGVSSMVRELATRFPPPPAWTVATAEVRDAPAPPSGGKARLAPWVVVGAGAAAVIAGGVVAGLAGANWGNLTNDEWKRQNSWETVKGTGDTFNTQVVVASVLLGAGVAALGGGLVWNFAGASSSQPGTTVTLVPAGLGLALGGSF